jgi:hypothetical protein
MQLLRRGLSPADPLRATYFASLGTTRGSKPLRDRQPPPLDDPCVVARDVSGPLSDLGTTHGSARPRAPAKEKAVTRSLAVPSRDERGRPVGSRMLVSWRAAPASDRGGA